MGELLNNRYRLLQLIATGGMGEVFLARQEGPGGFAKTVVVKRILRHLAREQSFVDLFLNEARLAAQLQHPNVAQVFALEKEGESWFIAMEYVHGRSLRAIIEVCAQRGVLMPQRVAVRLVSQALQALHFAHELKDERGRTLGVLHRDVTPENLLVSFTGIAKLVDFGIAKAMTGTSARVGLPKGKVAYMAPELTVSGSSIDRRADVYGAGVLLHEALTGERPSHLPQSVEELDQPPKAYVVREEMPMSLNRVLSKAMAHSPQERWPSAEMMSEALEVWLSNGGVFHASEVADFMRQLFGTQAVDFNPAAVHSDQVPMPMESSGVFEAPMAPKPSRPAAATALPMGTRPLADSADLPTVVTDLHQVLKSEGMLHLLQKRRPPAAEKKSAGAIETAVKIEPRKVLRIEPAATQEPATVETLQVRAPAVPETTTPGLQSPMIAPEVASQEVAPSSRNRLIFGLTGLAMLAIVVGGSYWALRPVPQPKVIAPQAATAEKPKVPVPPPAPVEKPKAAETPAPETVKAVIPPAVEAGSTDKPVPATESETPAAGAKSATGLNAAALARRPKMGKVTIRVNPWAEVIWGGKSFGVTPIAPIDLPAGLTMVTLKNTELGVTRKIPVRVPAGGGVVVKADLFEGQ